jgi:hypothetical protein
LDDLLYQKWIVDVSGIPNQIVVMPKGTETFEIFKVDDEMLYGDYITVMASAMEALNDLKERVCHGEVFEALGSIVP